jgi:hypothetical protein
MQIMRAAMGRLTALILVLVAAVTFDANAVTVRGRVDRQTSYGTVNAGYVRIALNSAASGRSQPAYTDPQGIYYLYNVPAGDYTLEVWSGSRPVTTPITVRNVPVFTAPAVVAR